MGHHLQFLIRYILTGALILEATACWAISNTGPTELAADSAHPSTSFLDSNIAIKIFYYFVLYIIVVVCELLFPVDKKQRQFSVSFFQDVVWYALNIGFQFSLFATYLYFLEFIYNRHFNLLTIESAAQWHPVTRAAIAILLADFIRWFSHMLRHKVPFFWPFHAIHHSQHEINLFTDLRLHPFDRLISETIKFIPLLMFQNTFPVIFAYAVFHRCYTMFYHGNIKTNLGILRYILVTPQSHRIHHSNKPEHLDKNFGTMFSIWDHLFGTQHRNYDEYPETGILDTTFPHEKTIKGWALLSNLVVQFLYPFRVLFRK